MALITAAQARLLIPSLTGSTSDTDLDTFIGRAGKLMASWCDYPRVSATADASLESATYTFYSGGVSGAIVVDAAGTLLFPVRPITSVTSIYDDPNQVWSSTYLLTSTDYAISATDGTVRLLPSATHAAFSTAPYAIKSTVVAGFTSGSIPVEIQHACAMVVRQLWDKKATGYHQSASVGGSSVQAQAHAIPVEAQEILAPYRQWRGLAA